MLKRGGSGKRLSKWILVILLLLMPSITMAFTTVLPTQWLTGGGTLGPQNNPDIMFEIAQPGNGIALNAGDTFVKFLFRDKNGLKNIGIFDGRCNSGGDYDHAPGGFCNGGAGQVEYNFYFTNETETVDYDNNLILHKDGIDLGASGWSDFGIDITKAVRSNLSGDYVVIMKASFIGIHGGRLNGFKVRNNSVGTVGYRSPGILVENGQINYGTSPAFQAATPNNAAYAIGNSKTFNSTEDKINFSFQSPCLMDKSPVTPQAYLRWTDADGSPSTSPKNWQINFDLWESVNGGPETKMLHVQSGSPATFIHNSGPSSAQSDIGGQDAYRQVWFNVRPNSNYRWEWNGVQGNNGIQMWVPFDTVRGDCNALVTETAQCVSVTAPDSVVQGQTFNATVSIKNTGNTTWNHTGANPYRMGASDARDTSRWGPISPGGFNNRALLTQSVGPGGTATVTFSAVATGSEGTGPKPFSWEMLQEGVKWIGGKCTKTILIEPNTPEGPLHKIYAANIVQLSQQQVRDNETFVATLRAYLWPDAGLRSVSGDRTNRLWLAGIYGEQGYLSGDNANSDNSKKANPNAITSYNTRAEASCPGSNCLERVPFAYVPANDGAGKPTTSTLDGSTTPNGNKWQPIRDRIFGSYNARLGGIASNDNSSVGGHTGNRIHNVEISNIRVEAVGPQANAATATAQGGVTSSTLQPDSATQNANLPGGSQGPVQNGQRFNAWDNIRRPGAPGGLVVASTQGTVNYSNSGSGTNPANFTQNPEQMLSLFSSTVNTRAETFATVNVTSLLQDGNDRDHSVPYSNLTEPLTYTAGINSIDNVRLKWDEYVDWSQVDDKGHYYTDQSNRQTGFYTGNSTTVTRTVVSSVTSGTQQSWWHPPVTRTWCAERDKDGKCTDYDSETTPGYWEYEQATCTDYNTGVRPTYNTYTYYSPSVQSQYGWINRNATFGSAYASPSSTRFWPSRGGTPAWATLGTGDPFNPYFYQDPSITSMGNSGSTNRNGQSQTPSWSIDYSDPTYNNRYLFVNAQNVTIPTGWEYTQSRFCYYANGGTVSNTTDSASYYPSPGYLYENSNGSYVGTYGQWNFTYDGNKDGNVDTSWNWAANKARVRYEQTYIGNYRNLGPRSTSGAGGLDGTLYGIEGYPSAAKLARASATIGSPIISTASGDIFSAGGISSYFRNSSAASAFIFTNSGSITNFLGASGYFPNYYINPDPSRVNSVTLPGSPDSIHKIFGSFDTEVVGKSQPIGTTMSGNFNLTSTPNRIYRVPGNLTMNATTFCGGPGTIYVEGDLTINGNTSYCAYNGTDRAQLPSVGIIVRGNVTVNPGVTNVVGSFFTNGTFSTGTVLDPAGTNRTTRGDAPFTLNGLVVAFNFALQRQLSGTDNISAPVSGVTAERFLYDGRVVVATPPAFNSLYSAPAVWNEASPSN